MRARHPKKDVEGAIALILRDRWWRLELPRKQGHVWGELKCERGQGGCIVRIHSTPQSPSAHAKHLVARTRRCPHRG